MKVTLVAAITIDGKLARNSAHFVDWTSREDKKLFFSTSKRAGVIIMGNNTFRTLPAPLPGRLHIILTNDLAGKESTPGQVEYTNKSPQAILADLEARGYTEVVLGGGSQANSLFLQSGLVDEISLTVEPLIFGLGIDLFTSVQFDLRARLLEVEKLNEAGSVHLRYSLR
jgi:dihydrofolate reductase